MTNSNKLISTNAYEPKESTNVWNFKTPSTRMTRRTSQQIKKMVAYLILRILIFILPHLNQSNTDKYFERIDFGSFDAMS